MKYQEFPTLSEIKERISKDLFTHCDDLTLYEFDGDYFGNLRKDPLIDLNGFGNNVTIMLTLVVRGDTINTSMKQLIVNKRDFETLKYLSIEVLMSNT